MVGRAGFVQHEPEFDAFEPAIPALSMRDHSRARPPAQWIGSQ